MTVHARRIASIPCRTPTETWRTVSELVASPGSAAREELEAITGIAAALITEEYTRDTPIIISGTGPQVRVYTLHGEAAIEADPLDETPLNHDPTTAEWTLSLPCGEDDLDEATQAVKNSPHVLVRCLLDESASAANAAHQASVRRPVIDRAAMERS